MTVEVAATRRRFPRAEYYRMAEVGILGRRDPVELIKGEIVEMSPIGLRHGAFVDNLTRLLVRRLPDDAMVRVQGPVALADDTEPQPDLAVLRRRDVPYKEREAWAEDALLVIEVAERPLAYDRSTKMRLYAEAGIPEYLPRRRAEHDRHLRLRAREQGRQARSHGLRASQAVAVPVTPPSPGPSPPRPARASP